MVQLDSNDQPVDVNKFHVFPAFLEDRHVADHGIFQIRNTDAEVEVHDNFNCDVEYFNSLRGSRLGAYIYAI